ncbi:MAG TPA: type II toxin-antitoxin system prevent-host-death family antitoxin [Lichenihabitans sp.]|jgi:prevent-host-death family protein|nr:type II toxin-antitoxin system prevent-host-death family antitoxin [Lichenihabitans sp.]
MILTVEVEDVAKRLGELLAEVASGTEVIIAQDSKAVARLTSVAEPNDARRAIEEIRAARHGRPRTTIEEILQWKDEDRR